MRRAKGLNRAGDAVWNDLMFDAKTAGGHYSGGGLWRFSSTWIALQRSSAKVPYKPPL